MLMNEIRGCRYPRLAAEDAANLGHQGRVVRGKLNWMD